MRVTLLLARRSASVIGGILIAAVDVWLAMVSMRPGLMLWPDLVTGLSLASVFTGILVAGVAAFEANRWAHANRDRIQYGIRSPAVARLQHAVATLLPLLAGFVIALIVLGLYARATGTYGSPSPAWLTALGGALLVAAAFGYGVGAAVGRHWFVAPAAALLFFGGFLFSRGAPLPHAVQALFPAVTDMDSVFVRYIPATMLGRLGFWVGAAAVILVAIRWGWRRGSRRWATVWITVSCVIASLGVGTVIAGDGQVATGHNPRDFVCKTGDFTLCLNRGYTNAMTPLYARLAVMNTRVEGTALFADRLEQNLQGTGDEPAPGARSIYLEQLEDEQDLAFAVNRYVVKYGGSSACTGSTSGSNIAMLFVDAWLSDFDETVEGLPQRERLEALQELSPDHGAAWFRSHATEYFSCTLTLDDLP